MKTFKLKLVWSLFMISLTFGCKKEEIKPIPEPALWVGCVTITDNETDVPIENVEVWWLWACCCQDMDVSDSTGIVCGLNEQHGDCSSATFIHSDYITEIRNLLPTEIQMQKKAFIKFNIANIPPSTVNDTLILNVQQANANFQSTYIGVGPFVDEVKIADPRHPEYTIYANGQWTTVSVSLTSGDTTEVWLNF